MVTRIGKGRRKTRHKFKKNVRERGKLSISKYFAKFELQETVALKINSAINKGQFHPRFHGKCGKVTGNRGTCYQIDFKDGSKLKRIFVHPIHLVKLQQAAI
ncbi:50S ribosomal protein L21e [archaeon]|jgi:large subunit ribosomal protein L21e|nr:50S ribosomal protein L21e [archaeon]MBT6698767.1 50S ribosomal protein L21e [archaeon]